MTTHAPAVPRRQPRPQAEHVVVAIAATLAFVGNAIMSCIARVRMIPPPSGED